MVKKVDYTEKKRVYQNLSYMVDITKIFTKVCVATAVLALSVAVSGGISKALENKVYAAENQEPPRIIRMASEATPYTAPIGGVAALIGGLLAGTSFALRKDYESDRDRAYDDDFHEEIAESKKRFANEGSD